MNRKLMRAKIRAMLVMDRERRLPLVDALESCGIEVLPVCDCNEARRTLETKPPVQVVITDSALPDGNWRRVLEIVAQECANIEVVVSLRLGAMTYWSSPTSTKRSGGSSKLPWRALMPKQLAINAWHTVLKGHLTELRRHAQELAATPSEWMPWNYRPQLSFILPLEMIV